MAIYLTRGKYSYWDALPMETSWRLGAAGQSLNPVRNGRPIGMMYVALDRLRC